MKRRIYSFDFVKVFFALVIALYHFNILLPVRTGAVQLFFIMSGFFLAKGIYSAKVPKTPWKYTLDHCSSLYPQYLTGLIALYLYHIGYEIINIAHYGGFSHRWIGKTDELARFVSELFMLQNSGMLYGGLNYPLWQICATLIAGHLVYAMLYHNRKLSEDVLLPGSLLLVATYLNAQNVDIFGTDGMFYIPLVRAYMGISFGALAYRLTASNVYVRIDKWLDPLSVISLGFLFFYGKNDAIMMIMSGIFILAMHKEDSWVNKLLNRKIFKGCGKLSYSIYINHALLIYVMVDVIDPLLRDLPSYGGLVRAVIFVLLLLVWSSISVKAVEWIKSRSKNRRGAEKASSV